MLCPSGCGDEIAINLDTRVGPAWRLYQSKAGLTLFPSVWRETGCKSHFVIWNGKIWWFDADFPLDFTDEERALEDRVLGLLANSNRPVNYVDVADTLSEVPWSVLVAFRRLAKIGRVREVDRERGVFELS